MFQETRSMAALKMTAEKRPEGYLEDVLSKCKWHNDTHYCITEDAFYALKEKYGAPPRKSRGLGDTIAKITTAVGVKPCGGCKKRQAKLNKLVPYTN